MTRRYIEIEEYNGECGHRPKAWLVDAGTKQRISLGRILEYQATVGGALGRLAQIRLKTDELEIETRSIDVRLPGRRSSMANRSRRVRANRSLTAVSSYLVPSSG